MRGLILTMTGGLAVLYIFAGIMAAVTIDTVASKHDVGLIEITKYMYKKIPKFRRIVRIYAIGLLVWVLIGTACIGAAHKSDEVYVHHMVQEGDTVWSIAAEQYGDEADIRLMVHRIEKINGIKDSSIYPGQIIKLPEIKQ